MLSSLALVKSRNIECWDKTPTNDGDWYNSGSYINAHWEVEHNLAVSRVQWEPEPETEKQTLH